MILSISRERSQFTHVDPLVVDAESTMKGPTSGTLSGSNPQSSSNFGPEPGHGGIIIRPVLVSIWHCRPDHYLMDDSAGTLSATAIAR